MTGTEDVDTAAKKTYECSDDHTGVLVCQYGFCSTDHYCKKGMRCSDGCACCKKGLKEVADSDKVSRQPEAVISLRSPASTLIWSPTIFGSYRQ